MPTLVARLRSSLVPLWRASAPLTAVSLLMLPALLACTLGLWLDPRQLLGAPIWLKPAKFAASIAIYGLTLSWILALLPAFPRLRRYVGGGSAAVFVIEFGIILVQAARGRTSHFNIGTPLDAVLFGVMGLAIFAQTVASAATAVALWRQRFSDRALGWALRSGLAIAVVGASLAGLMTRPTAPQLDAMRAGQVSVSGAHTVGAVDGGPGLAVTGWSREHGDLRVPHFVGLHAVQLLPLLALATRKRRSEAQRGRLILGASLSYVGLVAILLQQALRGQALLRPDAITLGALIAWAVLTLGGLALLHPRRSLATASTVPS